MTWIRRFILFHDKRHPTEMGEREVVAFLTHLAVERHVSVSTQNQALGAVLFLYRRVFCRELADLTRRCPGSSTHAPSRGAEPW